ncbi:AAA domain-containing protein [Halonotius sp. GCM10025705]|uniref:AAA domain-containing protein n=1 Tax=Halonotius sp. GCM10025705 TaxID=3252678 RepID=UPI0036133B82
MSGLITAPSNTAVDEVLESTADRLNTLSENGVHGLSEETVDIVRVTHETPDNPVDGVEYIHYSDGEGAKRLRELRDQMQRTDNRVVPASQADKTPTADGGSTQSQSGQATIDVFDQGESTETDVTDDGPPASEQSHTLIFATPTSSWGMLKKVCTASSPDPEDIANFDLWDLIVADEASMLTLPKLILAGTAMKRSGQLLLGGDHRQLPPVQKHEWEDTHRKSIVEAAPHLSALNYFRLLGGDLDDDHAHTDSGEGDSDTDEERSNDSVANSDTDVLDADERDRLATNIDPDNNPIPLIQLDTTFRFGPETADFIGNTVYDKDGIDYSATEHDDIPELHRADTEPLQAVFADNPITVITYDSDRTFQQVNPIESTICNILLLKHSHEATAGVVTPHNAQRSRLRSNIATIQQRVENPPVDLDNGTQVETVNRFQGGQNDMMIVSATASNPQFIRSESDFLLELNRANVAFSRHKYKLIVVMAESLLSHIPDDPDTYDQSLLWKTLSRDAGEAPTVDANPVWNGTLSEFTEPVTPPNQELADNTDVSIFHL